MEANNRPLALNAWEAGPNSYLAAREVVNELVNPENNAFYRANPRLTAFIVNTLDQRLASQSQKNHEQYVRIRDDLRPEHNEYVAGQKSPAELVAFLDDMQDLESIEIARRTHVGQWGVRSEFDAPIRQNLDEDASLETVHEKSAVLYSIQNLNDIDKAVQHSNYSIQVDRKRTVRQHFGGQILTIVRNSFVLHNSKGEMPRHVRGLIREQRELARKDRFYDYNVHQGELHDALEGHVISQDLSKKPTWIIPLLTTYYAAMEEVVPEELKSFN